jgi:hypothetical protein
VAALAKRRLGCRTICAWCLAPRLRSYLEVFDQIALKRPYSAGSPEQKEQIVVAHSAGYYVAMMGDGVNGCAVTKGRWHRDGERQQCHAQRR